MIKTFCQEEAEAEAESDAEGEGRRLDGHEDGEAHDDSTPEHLCMEARMQYASAVSAARAVMEEQSSSISGAFNDVVNFISNDSTLYYVGAATLSAAATLAF